MLASPASTTVRISSGSTPKLERVDGAGRVLRLADRPRAEAGAGAVAHGVVERRADDRNVDVAGPQLRGIRDPRELHERGQTDVGGQVEVVERLVRAVPAVARGEVAGARVVGTLGHWWSSRDGRPIPDLRAAGRAPPQPGRRRFGSTVRRGAQGRMVARRSNPGVGGFGSPARLAPRFVRLAVRSARG